MRKTPLWLMMVLSAVLLVQIPQEACAKISIEEEKRIGAQAAAEIDRKEKVTTQGEFARRVREIGEKLVQAAENRDFQFTFKVIDKKEVNAFALPGGYIYVYTGLKKAVETDDQLAAVLAHEIIHVTNRHWARQYEKAQQRNLILSLGLLLTKGGKNVRLLAGVIDFVEGNKYSRRDESNADYDGMELMVKAGYNPDGMVEMLQNLSKVSKDTPRLLAWTSDHPSIRQRIEAAKKHAEEIRKRQNESTAQ
ncbi:MAG: M48 family metallopeptidase [Abditibacteriales bacterium]|nr:M48 family metallopeptidase [Abditibacteriales bacterium]MDW8364687.1 M48 family metallopeptidase [Abditibacteriales bacterium]